MAKQKNNEDKIIAEAFISIRTAILEGNWQLVCDAYESISGEKLDPPEEEKSRLDNIRDLMQAQEDKPKPGRKPKKEKPEVVIATEKEATEEVAISSGELVEQKIKNGMTVITTEFDEQEASLNKVVAAKKSKLPTVKRSSQIIDNSDDENADSRFHSKPKIAPPWR
jgi:hypothetical protein